jgi:hypothetical protein
MLFTVLLVFILPISANQIQKEQTADFNMIYKVNETSYIVNNSKLPEMIGFKLPYSIHCTNLSVGGEKFEWFIRAPGKDYVSVDTSPNPIININNYGPTYIKLKINNSDNLTKEYCVTANEYGITSKIERESFNEYNAKGDTYSVKSVIKTVDTVVNPEKEIPEEPKEVVFDKDYIGKPFFKISYEANGIYHDVTDGNIPEVVKELPYKIILRNTTKVNTNFTWYIKVPSSDDYVWMDNSQNSTATIWQYGTTKFKLVLNGNESNNIEHSVTAYSAQNSNELEINKKQSETMNSSKLLKLNSYFKINYTFKDRLYDVTNAYIPGKHAVLPFKISLLNLSEGDKSFQWSIKMPGDRDYKFIDKFEADISAYGTTSIRLKTNDDIVTENKVTAYFSNDISDISNHRFENNFSSNDAQADFLMRIEEDGLFKTVNNAMIKKTNLDKPVKVYLSNLSKGSVNDKWYIKFSGKDYVLFDTLPNPEAFVWTKGTVYFKLAINGDTNKSAEYFIKIFSEDEIPVITEPKDNSVVDIGEKGINISWQQSNSMETQANLYNETRKKLILQNKIISKNYNELLSRDLLEEGCVYSLRIFTPENGLSHKITFRTNGTLDFSIQKPEGYSSFSNPLKILNDFSLVSKLNRLSPEDYFLFKNDQDMEANIKISSQRGENLGFEILDRNNISIAKGKSDEAGEINYTRVLRAGDYVVKIHSLENLGINSNIYKFFMKNQFYAPKLMLLYTGYGYKNDKNALYPEYTDNDLDKLVVKTSETRNTKDILILNGNLSYYGAHEAIPREKEDEIIDSIKIENNKDLKSKEMIKNEIKSHIKEFVDFDGDGKVEKNPEFVPYNRTLDSFAEESVKLALRVLKKNPDTRLWFSFPAPINSTLADLYTEPYKEKIIKGMKLKLDSINPDIWRNNVVGFYYSLEDVPQWYTPFNEKDNTFISENQVVKNMQEISQVIHDNYNKFFVWIPYIADSEEAVRRIGYIANSTNIFDYVIIQPNRIFDGTDYDSKGTGADVIKIEKMSSGSKKLIKVKIDGHVDSSIRVHVIDSNGSILINKEFKENSNVEITFPVYTQIYTITAKKIRVKDEVTDTEVFSKTIVVDSSKGYTFNIPQVARSVDNNIVYYKGTNGMDGLKVSEKTSNTKIGFQMEIDAYYGVNPDNIDFNKFKSWQYDNIADAEKWSQKDKSVVISNRNAELNKYYKYLANKKNEWYKEYTEAFNKYKNSKAFGFYSGDKNQLVFGISDGLADSSSKIAEAVLEFIER